jgi:excisionase family DNA binding protein
VTRPVLIPGPGLFVPADVAAVIAPTLTRALSDARRLGMYPDPPVTETIERLATLGAAWVARHGDVVVAPVDEFRCDPVESVTVQEAARQLNVSETAVKARLSRGTLPGVKDGRAWRVDAQAVRREATCR